MRAKFKLTARARVSFKFSLSKYLSNKGLQGISDSKLFNTTALSDSIPSLTFLCQSYFAFMFFLSHLEQSRSFPNIHRILAFT